MQLQPLQFLPPFLNVPNSVEDGQTDDSDWSYTARLAYDISPFLNVYVSYATGFKASSFNLSRDSRPLAADIPAIVASCAEWLQHVRLRRGRGSGRVRGCGRGSRASPRASAAAGTLGTKC